MNEMIGNEGLRIPPGTDIRRLAYSDLPTVISIERRSFPTPWSLAMFVLELSKPSGICLAATDERGIAAPPPVCTAHSVVPMPWQVEVSRIATVGFGSTVTVPSSAPRQPFTSLTATW